MRFRVIFIIVFRFLITIFLLAIPSVGYAKGSTTQFAQVNQGPLLCIIDPPNTAAFPNIKIDFRLVDPNLTPITNIAEQDLRISENNQPAVPVLPGMLQKTPTGAGIDYYFVIDKGNRTSQASVKTILQQFNADYFNEQTDTIHIYTDEKNNVIQYYPGSSGNTLTQAVSNFPIADDSQPRQMMGSFSKVNQIEVNPDVCQKTRVIIIIMGDGTLPDTGETLAGARLIKTSFAKLSILHLPSPRSGSFDSQAFYTQVAQAAGGDYRQIKSLDDDPKAQFDKLFAFRQTFSATYRTNNGTNGQHQLAANFQGKDVSVEGSSSYEIKLLPAAITVVGDTLISRIAQSRTEKGFTFNKDAQVFSVKVSWPDGYPRQLALKANLVLAEGSNEQRIPVNLIYRADDDYEFTWNFSAVDATDRHDFSASIEAVDEFGVETTSPANSITLLTDIPFTLWNWVLYGLLGLVALLIVIMLIMWRKFSTIAQKGGAQIGKIVGDIRKTIVGGGRKPLATLYVLDGPPSMIGQKLKITTEMVKLGRDPQRADMTFYTLDALTSVSGLHARLEKV